MAKQSIGLGSSANDGNGDTLRAAGTKINANTDEIYARFGSGTDLETATSANILVGNGTKFASVATSGDFNISSAGAINVRTSGAVSKITIPSGSAPGSTANALYNIGGSLYFNGSVVGTGNVTGMTAFSITGDSGSAQSVTQGNTVTIAGGTGIASVASATDTITLNIDSTVATLTGTQTLTNKSLTAPTLTGSSSAAGSILFKEDTDNGTNAVTLIGPAATADVTVTLPAAAGTLALTTDITVTASSTTTFTNKTLTSAVLNTGVSGTAIKDEDNMSSDSATHLATQQSIKAYVDANALSLIDEDNMSTNSATRPPSQQSVKAYVDANAGGTLAGLSDTAISSSAAGQTLLYDGSNSYDNKQIKVMQDNSAFTTAFPTIDTSHIFRVTAVDTSGNAYYTFENFESSGANTNDPSLYLLCNHTYAFYLGWGSGHPFAIRTGGSASGAGTNLTASNGGDNLVHIATDGTVTTGTSANAKSSGWLIWQIPNFSAKQNASTGNYGYQCTSHAAMFGQIYIGRVQDLYGSW